MILDFDLSAFSSEPNGLTVWKKRPHTITPLLWFLQIDSHQMTHHPDPVYGKEELQSYLNDSLLYVWR